MDEGVYSVAMNMDIQLRIMLLLPLALQLIGLAFVVFADSFLDREHKTLLLIIASVLGLLLFQNYWEYHLSLMPATANVISWRTLFSYFGYVLRPVVIVLFIRLVDRGKIDWPLWALVIINAGVYLTAFFSHASFWIDEQNHFQAGPLRFTCHIFSLALLFWLAVVSARKFEKQTGVESTIPLFIAIMVVFSVGLDSFLFVNYYITALTVAMITGSVFYYLWLHLQFVRAHESALRAEQRIKIMISQIQPHFMFNTLSTIQALCLIDPQKAFETVEKFGTYLRQNIDSLNQEELIPFEKELDHTRVYSDIEQIRFPSIRIEYHIEDKDFYVPALTIQPLVENSIRHGVRIREDGYVMVDSHLEDGYHMVTIADNGVGFDAEDAMKSDSSHIGLRNAKDRIETLCGGIFNIMSEFDEGTVITIKIPVERNTNEDHLRRR